MGRENTLTLGSRLQLTATTRATNDTITVTLNQWRVLSQVPECQRVGQICVRLGMKPQVVLGIIEELIGKGLVSIAMMQPSALIVSLADHHSHERELRRSA